MCIILRRKKEQVSNPSLFNRGREIVLRTTKRKAKGGCNLGNRVGHMVGISFDPRKNTQRKR
jgi:hypothetical protein